jgi:hypothetical protein
MIVKRFNARKAEEVLNVYSIALMKLLSELVSIQLLIDLKLDRFRRFN